MSSELLLRARGVSKAYSGTKRPMATLCHTLFGSGENADDAYPVLKEINLDIARGETVGIMGRNGAGKTTLLGILGGVTLPSTGEVEQFGRVATLLGLTAGFNPNFSGRENAYLFCSIQGLTRGQTDQRIDNIMRFADLGRHFDLPLRTYSSGMQARLAFSCAVHVDADLIIIDETLAVGDANFRMKCYERIRKMKNNGQTFLLVSHNQNLVANFCTRGIVLDGGEKVYDGATFEAVEVYKRIRTEALGEDQVSGRVQTGAQVSNLPNDVTLTNFLLDDDGDANGRPCLVSALLTVKREVGVLTVNFGLTNSQGIVVCAVDGAGMGFRIEGLCPGDARRIEMRFDRRLLPGRYYLSCLVSELIGDVSKPQCMCQNVLYLDFSGREGVTGIADLKPNVQVVAQQLTLSGEGGGNG